MEGGEEPRGARPGTRRFLTSEALCCKCSVVLSLLWSVCSPESQRTILSELQVDQWRGATCSSDFTL